MRNNKSSKLKLSTETLRRISPAGLTSVGGATFNLTATCNCSLLCTGWQCYLDSVLTYCQCLPGTKSPDVCR